MNGKAIALVACICFLLFGAKVASAQTKSSSCSPSVSFGKLLNGVQISNRGYISLGQFYLTCLPEPVRKSSSNYPYDPDDGGKLSTVLKRSDGKVLTTYVWYAENISGLWVMDKYKVVGGQSSIKQLEPGDYELEFAIEDKPFYRFPFSVSKIKNNDIYNPGDLYLLDGLWNDYGGLYYPKVDRYLQFLIWLRDKSATKKKETRYELKLIRVSDGKVVAEDAGADSALLLTSSWTPVNLSFRPIKDGSPQSDSYEFHPSELLKVDGNYIIRFTLDGKLYGEYPFLVKGGQIQYQGNQVRESSALLMYIESGKNSWWLKRK